MNLFKTSIMIFTLFFTVVFANVDLNKTYTVIVPKNWEPYFSLDEKNRPTGFAIDMFDAIAKDANIKFKYQVEDSWKVVWDKIEKNPNSYILANNGITDKRKKYVSFSNPTDTFQITLFKRKNSANIKTIEDLKNKKVAVIEKNVGVRIIKEYPELISVLYINYFDAIRGLLSGSVDAIIFPKTLLKHSIEELDLDDKIITFGKPLLEIKRGVSLTKDLQFLLDPINKSIDNLKKSGKYNKIYNKWFGKEETIELTYEEIVTITALIVIGIIILISAIIMLIIRKNWLLTKSELENQLNIRTEELNDNKEYLEKLFNTNPNILFTSNKKEILTANKAFLSFTNSINLEDFMKVHKCIAKSFKKESGYLTKYTEDNVLWIDYILNNPDKIHKVIIYKIHKKYVFEVKVTSLGKKQYLIVLHDISKIEKIKLELERSNEDLQQFAYTASHDLQEPLRMVSSYLQLVEKRYKDKLDNDGIDFINFAVDGAKRMQTLIDGLLQFSRIHTKANEHEEINMNDVLSITKQNLLLAIEEKDAEIIMPNNLINIVAEKRQMIQLFQNIIGNALKYTKKQPIIEISSEENEESIIFKIKDNGIGIDKHYFEKIFLIFQRLHTKDSEYKGTGIGLAICKRIMQRHNGEIWLESEVNEGTTFFLSFPKIKG